MSWTERIPAAIEKSETVLAVTCPCSRAECTADRGRLTTTEVALAKALWDEVGEYYNEVTDEDTAGPWYALRIFTEKVEQYDGG